MNIDLTMLKLIGRLILINVVPFILVFHMVIKRRRQFGGKNYSDVALIAGEIKIIGILGYFVILSIFFFSIPVLEYTDADVGYNIRDVEPGESTVLVIATISFMLVVAGIFLERKKVWAYRMAKALVILLTAYAITSTLHYGAISLVPIIFFSYFINKLKNENILNELEIKK